MPYASGGVSLRVPPDIHLHVWYDWKGILGGSCQDGRKWLITRASKSPNWSYSPSKWPKWLVDGGY